MPPFFAGTDVVARIEREESELVRAGAEAARLRGAPSVLICPLAGGIAAWAGEGSPFNKIAGLGFEGTPRAEEMAAVEFALAHRATPVRVELASLADPAIPAILSRRGYRLVGFENVLGLPLADFRPAACAPEVEIRDSGDEEFPAWLDVVVEGFANPDDQGVPSDEEFSRQILEHALGDLARSPGFSRQVALRSGAIAGGASLRIGGGIAQLCGAATLPAHRRHGIQTALLHARLGQAREAGCDLAVVTTQPGSRSQQNVERQGFRLLYVRAVLVRGQE